MRVEFYHFTRAGEEGEARHDAVGMEAVGAGLGEGGGGRGCRRVHVFRGEERHGLEPHALGIEVLGSAALGVDAVEAADDLAVDEIDDRLGGGGGGISPGVAGVNAFLEDDFGDGFAAFGGGHAGALASVETLDILGAVYRHDPHAVGPGIGLDEDEGSLIHAVLPVFLANLIKQPLYVSSQAFFSFPLHEIDFAAILEEGVDEPGVEMKMLGKFRGYLPVVDEVFGFEAICPAEIQGRKHDRLAVLEDFRSPAG